MENVDRLKQALVDHLATKGFSIVPKRASMLMWIAHVILWPFMKLAGKSFIDNYVTTGNGKIHVPVPAGQPQTVAAAVARVDVTVLAHELTHVYQRERSGAILHSLRYLCPQLPILSAALALIPVHVWLASVSPWGHLIAIMYLIAIAFSLTPLVTLIPWRPRYEIEQDAYITSVFTLHALYGGVEREYVMTYFEKQLAGSPYLWPAPKKLTTAAAESAYSRITRHDPTLLNEVARGFVRHTIG